MASDYDAVICTPLKIKGSGSGIAKKKKIKKNSQLKERLQEIAAEEATVKEGSEFNRVDMDKRTPAQIAFEKMQEKRLMQRVLKKASRSHKKRVEDFNRHLDTLTEHYDIPKVSWTK
uniref:protein FAM32A n=1 Tax=Myxine glutinosa TaxID=7769 RepID=UPI00358F033A